MARNFPDWLGAYLQYTTPTEAPTHLRFWAGVSAIAGALQRKVWINQEFYQWYPNFYILIVAPPAVVQKTTTAGIAMRLLRQVPGAKFGPDVVTWPALIEKFAGSKVDFPYNGSFYPQCALTLESGELGNLIDPQDRAMVDLLVALWDGKQGTFEKETKSSGIDKIINPWINLIGCTTPAWIAGNFPDYMIGGGFTSRCVFVYAEKKVKKIAYPKRHIPPGHRELAKALVEDLIEISKLCGEYELTEEAYVWGEAWYDRHVDKPAIALNNDRFGGYLGRKQVHIHKLAMVLAASRSPIMVISAEILQTAEQMVTDLEADMAMTFDKIGRSEVSFQIAELLKFISLHGEVKWSDAYVQVHHHFPSLRAFTDFMDGLLRSKQLVMLQRGQDIFLQPGPNS